MRDNTFVIANFNGSLVLDVSDFSTQPGARILSWVATGGPNQEFVFEPAGNDDFIIRSVHSGLVLDVNNFSNDNGAQVLQWNSTGTPNQKWTLMQVGGGSSNSRPRFSNPLVNGWEESDPSMVYAPGYGYFRVKTGGPGVILNRGQRLQDFSRDAYGVDRRDAVVISGNICGGVWAPELQQINGSWYIYFAAIDGSLPGGCWDEKNRRMFVAKGDNADPWAARFNQITALNTDGSWAIDGVVLQQPVSRELYFVYAGSIGKSGASWSSIYIKKMTSPTQTSGTRTDVGKRFSHRDFEKDTDGWGVREGPEILIHGNKINIVYSAAGSWDGTYCLSGFYASVGSDLMNSNSWTLKDADRSGPMRGCQFERHMGTGHNSFFKSPDGNETWMTYHRYKDGCTTGWNCRVIHAKRIGFHADDTPEFGMHSRGEM